MNTAKLVKGKVYLYFDKEVRYEEHTLNKRVFYGVADNRWYSLAEGTVNAYVNER